LPTNDSAIFLYYLYGLDSPASDLFGLRQNATESTSLNPQPLGRWVKDRKYHTWMESNVEEKNGTYTYILIAEIGFS